MARVDFGVKMNAFRAVCWALVIVGCGGETTGVDGGADATSDVVDAGMADAALDAHDADAGLPPCTCAQGLVCCNAACVDLNVDPKNCGGCGITCPSACVNYVCQ
jgi:hypothetical protein